MSVWQFVLGAVLGCGLLACQNQNLNPVPAVIIEPDADSRGALLQAVSEALNGVEVILSADALTESSELIIERRRLTGREALDGEGRRLDRPARFHLQIQGGACILVHRGTGKHQMLADTRCSPE